MKKLSNLCLVLLALATVAVGCGDEPVQCDVPDLPDPNVILSPDSVPPGSELTLVASFDQPLFDRGSDLPYQDVVVIDAATGERIGTYSDTWLDLDWRDGPIVSGVVLDGEVIDEFSVELTVEFPNELADGAIVQMNASNQDPHCYAGVSAEAALAVEATR